jgi:uncharacterized protein
MARQPTYPGVYIEEVPSGVRTITGVATSIAAFVDGFAQGPMNRAVQVFNVGDFEREFGGLDARSEGSYQIRQFFANGGTEAWVVRTASGSFGPASVQLLDDIGGAVSLTVTAIDPGHWGNALRVSIDYPAGASGPDPASSQRFNLTVLLTQPGDGDGAPLRSEVFRNLSMDAGDARFVESVLNDDASGSKLVIVEVRPEASPPLQTGTLSGTLEPSVTLSSGDPQLSVTIGNEGSGIARLGPVSDQLTLRDLRERLQDGIRSARLGSRAFSEASVTVVDGRLRVLAGQSVPDTRVTFTPVAGDPTVVALGLTDTSAFRGLLSDDLAESPPPGDGDLALTVTIGGNSFAVTLNSANLDDLDNARSELEARIRSMPDPPPAFADARVIAYTDGTQERLIVLAGVPDVAVACAGEAAQVLGLDAGAAAAIRAHVSEDLSQVPSIADDSEVDVQIGGDGPHTASLSAAATLQELAATLQSSIRDVSDDPTFAQARVGAYDAGSENRLVVLAGIAEDPVIFTATGADATTVTELLLDDTAQESERNADVNVQLYSLGVEVNPPDSPTAQGDVVAGADGLPPDAGALIGVMTPKTGLHALEDVDLFNILCIPRTAMVSGADALSPTAASEVMRQAITYCERRRAVFIVDTPSNVSTVAGIKDWLDENPGVQHRNAALYFPRVRIADPLDAFRLRAVGASGTMAGLYARTDGTRGVWKAPAGTEATLTNVQRLDYALSDAENGTINPQGINALRSFPVYGMVAWGARTLVGADQMASEWKYLPVRRTALFLQESLYRGTQWVVFEPNDEPLWAQIRLNIGAFMHNLFRQGAFQGTTPREAYLVKCDRETTTQNDIDRGIVNVLVGFAPLKPAEFVFIRIQQIAGQLEA